jgi:hypothetical protein
MKSQLLVYKHKTKMKPVTAAATKHFFFRYERSMIEGQIKMTFSQAAAPRKSARKKFID